MSVVIERRPLLTDPDVFGPELPPVLRRVYAARGVTAPADLDRSFRSLHEPGLLGGLREATGLLAEVMAADGRILIVGDFDADGATSCAVMVRGLRALGARDVDYLVPNRFEFGYGLTPEIVAVAARSGPQLIVTVDNGIASLAGVQAAVERGIRVIVTDHHLPGAELPAADAIVNPNLPGDPFPSKHLAGVGVAFYLLLALRARLRDQGWFRRQHIDEPNLAALVDLVALGTVADVVVLDRNNRILVEQGLRRIRSGQCVPGIGALLQVSGRHAERTVASDLGFAVGPRLNAAGRLDDMSLGIECLLTADAAQAADMAAELDALNRERRDIEARMRDQALAVLARLQLEDEGLPSGLCLYDPAWHQGVIGIVAGRVKDRYHRPVVAFAEADDGLLKGSARSIPGVHMRDLLSDIATRHPGLIERFGGHAMAAGLSLARNAFEAFRAAYQSEVERRIDPHSLRGVIHSDGELTATELTLETANLLRAAGPWGQGFPEPLFDGVFRVIDWREVGRGHLKLRLQAPGGPQGLNAIAFGWADRIQIQAGRKVGAAYRLDANHYQGTTRLQLMIEHLERV